MNCPNCNGTACILCDFTGKVPQFHSDFKIVDGRMQSSESYPMMMSELKNGRKRELAELLYKRAIDMHNERRS